MDIDATQQKRPALQTRGAKISAMAAAMTTAWQVPGASHDARHFSDSCRGRKGA